MKQQQQALVRLTKVEVEVLMLNTSVASVALFFFPSRSFSISFLPLVWNY